MGGAWSLRRVGGTAGILFLVLSALLGARIGTSSRVNAQTSQVPTACQANVIFNIAGLQGQAGSTSSVNAGNLYALNVTTRQNAFVGRFTNSNNSVNNNNIALNGLAVTPTLSAWYAVAQANLGTTSLPGQGFATQGQPIYTLTRSGNTLTATSQPGPNTGRTLVMGGFDSANGIYYYAGYNGSTLEIFAFNPALAVSARPLGQVLNVPLAFLNTGTQPFVPTTGDLAFDGAGDMFIVAGQNTGATNRSQVVRVNAADVPTTAPGTGQPVPSATAVRVGNVLTATNNTGFYNGIAFAANGSLYAQYASTSPAQATLVTINTTTGAATTPGGANNQTGVPGAGPSSPTSPDAACRRP